MNKISRTLKVDASADVVFAKFVHQLNDWWPKEYTWSQEGLVEIKIDAKLNGLCTEIGPYNFRCDWGRVLEIQDNKKIVLKWQISSQRVPEPNPEKASDLTIKFNELSVSETEIELEHSNFSNHGQDAEVYQQAMDSEQGWDYILRCFIEFCKVK